MLSFQNKLEIISTIVAYKLSHYLKPVIDCMYGRHLGTVFGGMETNCKIGVLFDTQNIFSHTAQSYLTLAILKVRSIF